MTKTNKVLQVMERDGHITRFIAVNYGITALTQHLSKLRERGYDVRAEPRKDADGNKYTRWYLGDADKQSAQQGLFQ